MNKIQPYNSKYPLNYYEIGKVYSFYARHGIKGKPASQKIVDSFEKYLKAVLGKESEQKENVNTLQTIVGKKDANAVRSDLGRFYAVVVDKVEEASNDYIVVMFLNKYEGQNNYCLKEYAVNFGCDTDGKNLMSVNSHFDAKSETKRKTGNITKTKAKKQAGNITRVRYNVPQQIGVGQITKVESNDTKEPKVGGITLVKKVGGITLKR